MVHITTAVDTFPQILTETYNQTSNLSSTAILTCHIRDLGEHHVTWFKFDPLTSFPSPLAVGKQLFTTDKRYSISFYSTSSRDSFWSLEIYQLKFSDEGTYICKITNRKASVSIYIHLHIQIPMMIYPTNVYIEPGASIKLNCSLLMNSDMNDTHKKSLITWHFVSNQINNTKPHDVFIRKKFVNNTLSSYLIIEHAQIFHTGVWTCVYKRQQLSAKVIIEKGTKI
ncbi:unnamed protein product [Adineta steineri]|uniref:Ig-like domain-containing protein n=1 Tax=Adineta steineri TaxID=433720 RepID=A0A814W645_9BILA|nr:unnamed protein product [Adineta steineri]CAF3612586.1 unnamed protein product [Adineta steineri]